MMNRSLNIVFEDRNLIVVEKPSGMLSMSTGRSGEVTAYSILYDYMQNSGRSGRSASRDRIFIVHRLDRDTSGLLVFAKDYETKTALQENWDEAVLERKYTAILEGHIEDEEGWIETWLHENPKSMMVHCHLPSLRRASVPSPLDLLRAIYTPFCQHIPYHPCALYQIFLDV